MGASGYIFVKNNSYDVNKTMAFFENLFKTQGYYYFVDKLKSDSEYYYHISISEYSGSDSWTIIYVDFERNDSQSEFENLIYFENIQSENLVLKILYEYFQKFPEGYFDGDSRWLFYKKDIEAIYKSYNWEAWVYCDPALPNERYILPENRKTDIRYSLNRDCVWQLFLRKAEKFDFCDLKNHLISFLKEKNYTYYEERYELSWNPYFHSLIVVDMNNFNDGFYELHIYEERDLYAECDYDYIKEGICVVMAIRYMRGQEKNIKEIVQKYFEWYPDDYMYNTNEYDYSETGERIYTKDTILTFGE